ncbi:hypothetical protein [Salinimicrobium sp. WS361]|uniref:hypothetical protein n=1 Tax=Salinimicrobium sp. WS361 TaxID=3425123 RepID=UPI003D6F335D
MWETEEIDNESNLYIRVHENFISSKDKKPKSSAFSNTPKEGDNLSSDWSKYCTPHSSRALIGKQKKRKDGTYKNPSSFFIWSLRVENVRNDINPNQEVKHDPVYNDPEDDYVPNNRAHSIIIGEKPVNNAEFRVGMLKIGQWAIEPDK